MNRLLKLFHQYSKNNKHDDVQALLDTYEKLELPEMTKPLQAYMDMVDVSEKGTH